MYDTPVRTCKKSVNRYHALMIIDISHSEEIYTISRLNREARFLLEGSFPPLWVEGEISNFACPYSGHWYFSLKDSTAQVRCAMFKRENQRLSIKPQDGMHVLAKVRISLYEGRGEFQLIVEELEEAGLGKLQKEFEALKKRLAEQGLFAAQHKKQCPAFPNTIGIITSPSGAAIHDILNVLKRRHPAIGIIIYPTLVQGEQAADNIVKALQVANQRNECDVLMLARGGGSIEDLWPFNEERVAHAIFNCTIPIISGIGHEIDFTIADFVADLRAPTPSAAAELVAPDCTELLRMLLQKEAVLLTACRKKLQYLNQHVHWAKKHLEQLHPKNRLAQKSQQLDLLELQLVRLLHQLLNLQQTKLHSLAVKLQQLSPMPHLQALQHQTILQNNQIQIAMQSVLQKYQVFLSNAAAKLDTLSPLATLKRGFAIVTCVENKQILHSSKQVARGDQVEVRLSEGTLQCTVDSK